MTKVYCKECHHLYQVRSRDCQEMKCMEVLQDNYYERKYGDPSKINANNDCKDFKLKKKKVKTWKYWFAFPWF